MNIPAALAVLFALSAFAPASGEETTRTIARVVDGDTLILDGGECVRVLGVDTPERGREGYGEATRFTEAWLLYRGLKVEIRVLQSRPRDVYGRTLAWVCADGESLSQALLDARLGKKK